MEGLSLALRDDVVVASQDWDDPMGQGREIKRGKAYRVVTTPGKLTDEYCVEPVNGGDWRRAVPRATFEKVFGDDASVVRAQGGPVGSEHRPYGNEDFEREQVKADFLAPRRVVRVPVTGEALAMFFAAPVGTVVQVHEQPLPAGAVFRGVTHDPNLDVLYLWFEHEKFEPVDAAIYPPDLRPTFHTVRGAAESEHAL